MQRWRISGFSFDFFVPLLQFDFHVCGFYVHFFFAIQRIRPVKHHVINAAQDNIKIRQDKHFAVHAPPTPTPSPMVNLDVTAWWDTPAAADMQTGLQRVKRVL